MNRVILVGNLGRDPEIRYMPRGDVILSVLEGILATSSLEDVTVATAEYWPAGLKAQDEPPQQECIYRCPNCCQTLMLYPPPRGPPKLDRSLNARKESARYSKSLLQLNGALFQRKL